MLPCGRASRSRWQLSGERHITAAVFTGMYDWAVQHDHLKGYACCDVNKQLMRASRHVSASVCSGSCVLDAQQWKCKCSPGMGLSIDRPTFVVNVTDRAALQLLILLLACILGERM